ncbi:hypothetical protein E2C01_035946 [Portunus trituberculatus]|uniref:Uncharacterized protein n=1 Tax=Portunus trituberculatus TaxID=210409 RepID=A0A5B7F9U9_PORTR|nr:hypothetical protein [Portunus trituberculatus]
MFPLDECCLWASSIRALKKRPLETFASSNTITTSGPPPCCHHNTTTHSYHHPIRIPPPLYHPLIYTAIHCHVTAVPHLPHCWTNPPSPHTTPSFNTTTPSMLISVKWLPNKNVPTEDHRELFVLSQSWGALLLSESRVARPSGPASCCCVECCEQLHI